MNRDMLKLRKDPTIPPSAATVTTSTTNAFPVSPRLGGTGPETRGGSRHRTSPKGPGTGQGIALGPGLGLGTGATSVVAPSSASATSATSMGSNSSPSATTATNVSTSGSTLIGGTNMVMGSSNAGFGVGIAPGSLLGFANGHATRALSGTGGASGAPRQSRIPASSPQAFKFDTGGTLWALSASPDFSMVAVVGRDVLKILNVTDNAAEEAINLKAVAGARNFAGSMDVKWGPTTGRDAKIATIGTNGVIFIWDIGTQNKIDRTIKEHTRAVSRICFSPQDPNLLLSASSDSTIRLWDLRLRDRPGLLMDGKDIVREVQFSPVSVNDIVAGYDGGNIQRWDLRNLSSNVKRFLAHSGFVTSLDYHPSGRFLASGGKDKTIKIWDMEDEKRREMHNIPTIQYTSKVQWRPNKPYQLAASFKDEPTVQIFDVRRPFVPLHILTHHDKDATSILWKDTDVLWSVSKDKTFASTHIKGQTISADLLPSSSGAMSCYGQLAFTVLSKGNFDSFEKDLIPRTGRPNVRSVALDGSVEATVYRTRQTGGVFDCELFNHEAFIYCAQNYSTDANNVREACEHNSNIAWQANRYRDSQTWTAIKLFYSDMAESAAIVSQVDAASTETPNAANKQTDGQAQDGNDIDSDASETQQSRPAVPSLFAIKVSDAPVKRTWSHEETIRSLLEYYAEQGEVQIVQ
ncbi:WD repeat-containing protein 24 [Entomortierella chlamydospora]|uniref:WD repeat-containing protein 24 n=1 Tax=Entomortierella chlamydospora TaxID=101097 RepID=A0A9P6SYB1_9FUNG|nr:WD repeat-containing protein 24 [Entomortierella chlamydospora]